MKTRYCFNANTKCRKKECDGVDIEMLAYVGRRGKVLITGTCTTCGKKSKFVCDTTWLRKDTIELAISGRSAVCRDSGCTSRAKCILEITSDGRAQLRTECPDCDALRATPWHQTKLQTIRPKSV